MEYSTISRTKIGFGEYTLNFSKNQRRERRRRTYQPPPHPVPILRRKKCWLSDWYYLRIVSVQGTKRDQWGNPLQNFGYHIQIMYWSIIGVSVLLLANSLSNWDFRRIFHPKVQRKAIGETLENFHLSSSDYWLTYTFSISVEFC